MFIYRFRFAEENPVPGRRSRPAAYPFEGWWEIVLDFQEAAAIAGRSKVVYRGWNFVQDDTLTRFRFSGPNMEERYPSVEMALRALLAFPIDTLSEAECSAIGAADAARERGGIGGIED